MTALNSPPASPPAITSSPFPYSAAFSDALMANILDGPAPHPNPGLTVLPPGTNPRGRTSARTIRFNDLSPSRYPSVSSTDIPLPLDDVRRTYISLVPSVLVTHVGGRLEGGSPLAGSADDEVVREFVARHEIGSREELQRAVKRQAEAAVDELRTRMRERREAEEVNERVDREVRELRAQREMERKVEEKMRREWRARDDD